jgi:hypothetical protein
MPQLPQNATKRHKMPQNITIFCDAGLFLPAVQEGSSLALIPASQK